MNYEISCGAVVFHNDDGVPKYVIVQAIDGVYGFPKGHMEPGETSVETAKREIHEETGLSVDFLEGFCEEITYSFIRNNKEYIKKAIYFLASYSDQIPRRQESEVRRIDILPFDTAMTTLSFDNTKQILKKAHGFLSHIKT